MDKSSAIIEIDNLIAESEAEIISENKKLHLALFFSDNSEEKNKEQKKESNKKMLDLKEKIKNYKFKKVKILEQSEARFTENLDIQKNNSLVNTYIDIQEMKKYKKEENTNSEKWRTKDIKKDLISEYVKKKIKLDWTVLYIGDEDMDLAVYTVCRDKWFELNDNKQIPRFFDWIRLLLLLITSHMLRTSSDREALSKNSFEATKFLEGQNPWLLKQLSSTKWMKWSANKILKLCKTGLVIGISKKEYFFQQDGSTK